MLSSKATRNSVLAYFEWCADGRRFVSFRLQLDMSKFVRSAKKNTLQYKNTMNAETSIFELNDFLVVVRFKKCSVSFLK